MYTPISLDKKNQTEFLLRRLNFGETTLIFTLGIDLRLGHVVSGRGFISKISSKGKSLLVSYSGIPWANIESSIIRYTSTAGDQRIHQL